MALSFIIPAYNEETHLPKVLESIISHVPSSLPFEIIVADNGSDDSTVKIARDHHAKVLVDNTANVGRLRNLAAKASNGRVLVFLDADILLTETWGHNIYKVYQSLISDTKQITGSTCGIPAQASWIERFWFKPLTQKKPNYINSGHLIIAREFFDCINGFDERLETGEDYALSQSALSANATITNNPLLTVIHEGYPKTLLQFIRREIWHGKGDCKSVCTIVHSKVSIMSITFAGIHFFSITSFLYFSNNFAGIFGLLLIFGICTSAAQYKHGTTSLSSIVVVSILYYFYFASRFLSCVSVVTTGKGGKRQR